MEIENMKSAAKVLERNCFNKIGLDLSKNVLWVKGQQTYGLSKLQVKTKFCQSARCGRSRFEPG